MLMKKIQAASTYFSPSHCTFHFCLMLYSLITKSLVLKMALFQEFNRSLMDGWTDQRIATLDWTILFSAEWHGNWAQGRSRQCNVLIDRWSWQEWHWVRKDPYWYEQEFIFADEASEIRMTLDWNFRTRRWNPSDILWLFCRFFGFDPQSSDWSNRQLDLCDTKSGPPPSWFGKVNCEMTRMHNLELDSIQYSACSKWNKAEYSA